MVIDINLDSVSSLIGAIITLTFTVYFFTSYLIVKMDRLNFVLSITMLTFFIYLLGYSLYSSSLDPYWVLFWTKISYSGGVLIIYTSYHFSSIIINKYSSKLNLFLIIYVLVLLTLIYLPSNLLFTDKLSQIKTHSSVIKGPFFPFFLGMIYIMDLVLIVRFFIFIFRNEDKSYLVAPILFGFVLWFFESILDGIFGAILSLINFKFSIGPIVMTFCLALYSGRHADNKSKELIKIKEEKRIIYNNLIYDKLSTLYTREYFLEALEQRNSLGARDGFIDSVMFIDVDNFKLVNDYLGHNIGDNLITYIGETIRHFSRKSDICARYGGDEFILLLENSTNKDSVLIAEKITKGFKDGLSRVLGEWEKIKEIGLSIGIVSSNMWPDDHNEILKRADKAMYQVKRNGRDSIFCFNQFKDLV